MATTRAFAYAAPTSVAEAVNLLGEHASRGERAQVLAGGTDLLVQVRSADREPDSELVTSLADEESHRAVYPGE